ncbi:unnamed protein product [Ixodes hexagonus]
MTELVLRELTNRFLACVPAAEAMQCLEKVTTHALTEELQEEIMSATLKHPTAKRFPAATSYVKHYLKLLIDKLENRGVEVIGDLYVCYTELLGSSANGPGFVTYILDGQDMQITLRETKALVTDGTTGLRAWQASKFLAEWCLENQEILHGKRVLELGSGVGLTGLVVCRACRPCCYTFTDGHEGVVRVIEENVGANRWSTMPVIKVELLRWGEQLGEDQNKADVVLGADLVFDPDLITPLVTTLADLLQHGGTAYVASTIRNAETYNAFQTALGTAMLQWTVVPPPHNRVFIYDRSCKIEILWITKTPP